MQVSGDFESSHLPELTDGLPLLGEHKAEHDKNINGLTLAYAASGNATSESTVHMQVTGGFGLFLPGKHATFVLSVSTKAVYDKKIQRCRSIPQTDDIRGHAAPGTPTSRHLMSFDTCRLPRGYVCTHLLLSPADPALLEDVSGRRRHARMAPAIQVSQENVLTAGFYAQETAG